MTPPLMCCRTGSGMQITPAVRYKCCSKTDRGQRVPSSGTACFKSRSHYARIACIRADTRVSAPACVMIELIESSESHDASHRTQCERPFSIIGCLTLVLPLRNRRNPHSGSRHSCRGAVMRTNLMSRYNPAVSR